MKELKEEAAEIVQKESEPKESRHGAGARGAAPAKQAQQPQQPGLELPPSSGEPGKAGAPAGGTAAGVPHGVPTAAAAPAGAGSERSRRANNGFTHRHSQELSMKHLVRHPRIQPFEPVGQFGLDGVYQPIRLLGRGGSGQTWLCRDRESRRLYALKMQQRPLPPNTVELTYNEITIQAQTGEGHINMCHIKEAILTPSHLALVLDYEAGGSVAEFVASRIPLVSKLDLCVSESTARFMFRQLISGVDFLHKNHIAHRDIKLDNSLLDGTDPPRVKLCDFQFARYWGPTPMGRMNTHLGTAVYMSPELITNRRDHHEYDPVEADVWACGIWLVALLVGAFPFDNRPGVDDVTAEMQILHQEMSGSWRSSRFVKPYVSQLTPECVDLLDKILHVDPTKRINIPQILAHPWIKEPFSPKLQQAWDRLRADQAAVTRKLKGMRFNYSAIHARNNCVLQLVNESAAKDPARDSYEILKKGGNSGGMVDFESIPHSVRIDMRPEAVAEKVNPRTLALLNATAGEAAAAEAAGRDKAGGGGGGGSGSTPARGTTVRFRGPHAAFAVPAGATGAEGPQQQQQQQLRGQQVVVAAPADMPPSGGGGEATAGPAAPATPHALPPAAPAVAQSAG